MDSPHFRNATSPAGPMATADWPGDGCLIQAGQSVPLRPLESDLSVLAPSGPPPHFGTDMRPAERQGEPSGSCFQGLPTHPWFL